MFLSIWDEIPSGPVDVLTFKEHSKFSTSSSVQWMVDSSGQVKEGDSKVGKSDGVEKQLEKYEFSRLASDSDDSAVVVLFVRMREIRSRFGDREW